MSQEKKKAHSNAPNPMKGHNILLTRPAPQQDSLRSAIEQAGGQAISLPLIEILGLQEDQAIQAARSAIENLDHYQILIFVSSNAVRFATEYIADFWPQFPVGIDVIAIGATTARAANTMLGITASRPEQGSDSEAVLQLPELQAVTNKRIAIIRGQGGRELLASTLQQRGARVDYIEVYRRQFTRLTSQDLLATLDDGHCTAITVHSGESLGRLMELGADNIDRVTLIPLVVPSQRVANRAQEAGFVNIVNADGADDESMMDALKRMAAMAK